MSISLRQLRRVGALLAASLLLAACAGVGAASNPTTGNETVKVEHGTLRVNVNGSGTVQPEQSAELNFGTNGTIAKVVVKEGAAVKQGDLLATLDARDLDQQVLQTEANLETAQARLEQAKNGNAKQEDKQAAKAGVDTAKAQLEKAKTGNVTEADLAAAQATVRNAEAGLQRARNGTMTQADIASAQAQVRNAEANLRKVKTGNTTPADIANAAAGVRQAEARLEAAKAGPTPDLVSTARTRLRQAQQNLNKTSAADSATKANAEQSMYQAAESVRLAKNTQTTADRDNQQAQSGTDPKTGKTFEAEGLNQDIQKRQYADALTTANLQLQQAQSRLEQAKVTLENAKQQAISDVATAQAQVDDARVQLDQLLKGPKSTDVAAAQAQLDQARAQLQKLRQGGSAADVAAAQAQVDQARAQLAKTKQGGTAADIAAAQAQIDQTKAQLGKLQQGGTPADIEAAQAQVNQAQAQFDKLSASATQSDLAIAQAAVRQAQAQVAAAKLSRDKTTLKAPFDGIVTVVNVSIGDTVGAAAVNAPITVMDAKQRHINVSIAESDVAQIRQGQPAQVTIDALGSEPITGTVTYIAPSATVVQNVTTYTIRVDLPEDNPAIRVGMSAAVAIGVAEKKDVLLIPSSAVRTEGNRHIVRLKTGSSRSGDTFTDTQIRTGLVNDVQTEVLSGLKEGDAIAALGVPPVKK